MSCVYRIVHISDLHFWRIPWNPLAWYGKRILGLSNLILRRARKFKLEAILELIQAIESDHPDHLVVSGDISTTSLESEFCAFERSFQPWLQDSRKATILCGNHDRYTRRVARMRSFENHFARFNGGGTTVFMNHLSDGLMLLGLDPCRPDPLFARGLVTSLMAEQLQKLVNSCQEQGAKVMIFVCHYPAEVPPQHEDHQKGHELREAGLLLEVLQTSPMPVYWLHGHIHHPWRFRSPRIPNLIYLNPGAPILRRKHGYSLGRWILDWDGQELRTEWRSLPQAQGVLEDLA